MAYPAFSELYRLSTPQSVALQSAGGAAVSCAAFAAETFAVALSFPGSVSSTGGVRIKVISNASDAAVTSNNDFFLPANWIEKILVTPKQKISAISNDAGTPSLMITELTK